MEPSAIYNSLVNAGGLGLLAAVLLYLHLTSLKVFREELAKERSQCQTDHEKIMASISNLTKAIARVVVDLRRKS